MANLRAFGLHSYFNWVQCLPPPPNEPQGKLSSDAALEERVKFAFRVTPVELVHMPTLKSFAQGTSKCAQTLSASLVEFTSGASVSAVTEAKRCPSSN